MKRTLLLVCIFLISLIGFLNFAYAETPPVGDWWGRVTINGEINDFGAIVDAYVLNQKVTSDIVGTPDIGYYLIHVNDTGGHNITFKVCGIVSVENIEWSTENHELNLSVNTSANGEICEYDCGCTSGYCVHGICRPSKPYCGDGYCDSGESYSNCPADCPAPPAPPSGGGGGPYVPQVEEEECIEDWVCTPWPVQCINGIKTRVCTDKNNCGTETNKPPEIFLCDICEPGVTVCVENDLMRCSGGKAWVKEKTCEYGCSEGQCIEREEEGMEQPTPPEETPQITENKTTIITPSDMFTGLVTGGQQPIIYGLIALAIIIIILYFTISKKRKKPAASGT